jgi:perosamine synthetase
MDACRDGRGTDLEAFNQVIDLAKPSLDGNERKYLLQAFDSGYLTHHGEWESRFEQQFGRWIGRPALATSSGTGALHIALLSLGVGPGDEVIVPTLTFGATASVVVACGARPVLVDVTENFGINWQHVKSRINRRTKAVISVHLYGEDAGYEDVGVPVIEDGCESLGMVEPRGHCTAYSLYGNKAITTGEGGMLVGNIGNARKYRDGGFTPSYDVEVPGLNYRMTNLQAAIGCAQLERIDDLIAKRLENAARYAAHLPGRGKWLFVVETQTPVSLQERLKKCGVDSRPVFKPLHLTQAFRQDGKFPKSEKAWTNGLCLPTGPHLTKIEQEKVIDLVSDHLHNFEGVHRRHAASV